MELKKLNLINANSTIAEVRIFIAAISQPIQKLLG